MGRIKDFCIKRREVLMYLIFGVLTTIVGWAVYFAILWSWKGIFSLPADDSKSAVFLIGYTVAQVIQWIAAVLFAFFTNRKWVFTEADKNVSTWKQLITFSAGRVVTFGLDYVVTLFGGMALTALFPSLTAVEIFGHGFNLDEIGAKVVAAIIVIVCNYIFSKLFVFKNRKK